MRHVKVHSPAISTTPSKPGECPCANCVNERAGHGATYVTIDEDITPEQKARLIASLETLHPVPLVPFRWATMPLGQLETINAIARKLLFSCLKQVHWPECDLHKGGIDLPNKFDDYVIRAAKEMVEAGEGWEEWT